MADGLVSEIKTITAPLRHWLRAVPDWQVMLFFMAATVLLRLMVMDIYPIPGPASPDCRANLFGAYTFAGGKITNPGKPWHQIFILDYPTQMMKYQPAMAGFMALGITLFGHPHWGVVLCMALAIATGYWALRGWVGKPIAFTGAIILMLLFRAPHYWIYNYSGGSHILLASFLMLGAYPRILHQHRYHSIIPGLLGFTLALLGRPFEGGILAIGLTACGIFTMFRWFDAEQRNQLLGVIWLPTLLILGSYVSFQLYYNYRITGDAFELPYMLYHKRFDVAPVLTLEQPNYANYSRGWLRGFQRMELNSYFAKPHQTIESTRNALLHALGMGRFTKLFFEHQLACAIGIILHLPLLYMSHSFLSNRNARQRYLPLLVSAIFSWGGFAITTWSFPHYMAPYFATLYLSLFVVVHDLKLHPAVNRLLAVLVIAVFIATGGQLISYP